jgi:hypothetical protein
MIYSSAINRFPVYQCRRDKRSVKKNGSREKSRDFLLNLRIGLTSAVPSKCQCVTSACNPSRFVRTLPRAPPATPTRSPGSVIIAALETMGVRQGADVQPGAQRSSAIGIIDARGKSRSGSSGNNPSGSRRPDRDEDVKRSLPQEFHSASRRGDALLARCPTTGPPIPPHSLSLSLSLPLFSLPTLEARTELFARARMFYASGRRRRERQFTFIFKSDVPANAEKY